jgi:hypothetical protein
MLIVFIELGVAAFRVNGGGGAVSAVGATLNAVSGVGVAANQQLSDKKDQIPGTYTVASILSAPLKSCQKQSDW